MNQRVQVNKSKTISSLKNSDDILAVVIEEVGPCLLERGDQGFSALSRSIISQQLSKTVAQSIHQRLVALLGNESITPLLLSNASESKLRCAGLSGQKTRYLIGLADLVLSGKIDFKDLETMDDEKVVDTLTQIKGVGRWTAEMYLIFSMNRPDVFPVDDMALRRAISHIYNIPREAPDSEYLKIADKWRPYRTIACWYLYRYFDRLRYEDTRR
ncbi:DNA-3-methyladenine glycosylase family protein [Chloroflexota bacterium]